MIPLSECRQCARGGQDCKIFHLKKEGRAVPILDIQSVTDADVSSIHVTLDKCEGYKCAQRCSRDSCIHLATKYGTASDTDSEMYGDVMNSGSGTHVTRASLLHHCTP